ncbi:MAG: carboxypeptidase-like regulatory domain-containing protein [Gemmataceae bacterium]
MIAIRRATLCVFAPVLLAFFAGCGQDPGTVTGKVSYQGKALKGGTVAFVLAGSPGGTSPIKEDGSYEVPNLKPGTYKILVETESLLPRGSGYGPKAQADKKTMSPPPGANIPEGYKPMNIADAEAAQKESAKKYTKIPLNFGKAEETPLQYSVVSGPQTFDIELK